MGAAYCARLEDLLQHSDFVMLATNLTPQTQGLIGRRELQLMKQSAVLVNIGRGRPVRKGSMASRHGWEDPALPLAFLVPLFLSGYPGPEFSQNSFRLVAGELREFMFHLEIFLSFVFI